jgi:chemotaxis protein methyltransferase CheR
MSTEILNRIPVIADSTFQLFRSLIQQETGIYIRENKRILLSNRLRKRLSALDLDSYEDYYRLLTCTRVDGKHELSNFVDAVSTNETYFFRGRNHFDVLKTHVFPTLFKEKEKIRVWSAGCSTGEEPYSISIELLESASGSWNGEIEVIATDINQSVLRNAENGVFGGRTLRFLGSGILNRYFENLGDGRYRILKLIRDKVHFKRHNLLRDDPPGYEFDIIFCRNVMIYFSSEMRSKLVDGSFARAISEDGYLFIGHSESLIGKSSLFYYSPIAKTPVYRLIEIRKRRIAA